VLRPNHGEFQRAGVRRGVCDRVVGGVEREFRHVELGQVEQFGADQCNEPNDGMRLVPPSTSLCNVITFGSF